MSLGVYISPAAKTHLWCLFDLSKQKLHQGLLFDEARAIIGSHDADDLANWFVWRDDWSQWQPATQVPGLDEMIYRNLSVEVPPLPVTAAPDGGPQGFVSSDLSVSKGSNVLSMDSLRIGDTSDFVIRGKQRYKKRYSLSIETAGKIFKTFTRDISVGGANVEDIIPDWVSGYFKIRLGKPNSKQQIELQCCLVEGQLPHARYRVMILPLQNSSDEANLEKWLAA